MRVQSSFRRGLLWAAVLFLPCVAFMTAGLDLYQFHAAESFESPVRITAMVNRTDFTEAEWYLLANRYHRIIGLSNFGYDMPGVIEEFRSRNQTTPVLAYTESTGIHTDCVQDDRFPQFDVEEDAFFHTADPASLRVVSSSQGNWVFFARDARALELGRCTRPADVVESVVQYSENVDGPYADLDEVPAVGDEFYHRVLDVEGGPQRYYRVRSRLSTGEDISYSWLAQPEPAASVIAIGWIEETTFHAVIHSSAFPDIPLDGIFVEVDWNKIHEFHDQYERFASSDVRDVGSDFLEFTGSVDEYWLQTTRCYRFAHKDDPTILSPRQNGCFSHNRYNNRLVTAKFGSHILKPAHPLVHTIQGDRLWDAVAAGYDGVRLDFTYDDLPPSWIAYAAVSERERQESAELVDSTSSMLEEIRSELPDAEVHINGRFVVEDSASYYEYLSRVSGGEIEFFGFGDWPEGTEFFRGLQALGAMVSTSHAERKVCTGIVGGTETNHAARLKSLALYLHAVNDLTYYCFVSDRTRQVVEYFPEWEVPLGQPVVQQIPDANMLIDPRGNSLTSREFAGGLVFINWDHTEIVSIDLGSTYYKLSVEGGRHPLAGGNGSAVYTAVQSLVIEPNGAAILVKTPPEHSGQNWGPVREVSGKGNVHLASD